MSALPLPSAATSCFADIACCADDVGTTLTVRPARLKSPSLMPMYSGASATPGGATTVMVPDAVGACEEPHDSPWRAGGTVVDTSERAVAPDSTLLAASARHTSVTSRSPSDAGIAVCAPFCG